MSALPPIADRLRLAAEIWLHRHGPWSLVLAVIFGSLLSLALILLPGLQSELAAKQATLADLQARLTSGDSPPAPQQSASETHYQLFRQTLAEEGQVLASIQAVLDSVASHQLLSTRAEYLRGNDALAQAETLQMIVPVRGRYTDVRRWLEETLARQPFIAVNELRFKREEIGLDEIEARIRLTIWHRPAKSADRLDGVAAGEVDR
ncbi:hypothetical protein [Accumulibacter sp.]|uniref:hypothetical protein n=1 Tax=Accumulibacter sp. TaxID=2053492 RepID=UPI00261CD0CA|nr:hypothetical protein [Accumulibacter sp.]